MIFGQPQMLWLMAATVPALVLFFHWSWRKRTRLIAQFVQSRLLASLTVGVSATRLKLRLAALVLAVTSLFLALARPQWGFQLEEVKQRGLDILVAIDTSRSMLATDIKPNRLGRARLAALDLLKIAKNDRLGLIAFAGSAFLHCPLTLDEEAFRQSLSALDVGIIPQGGTDLSEAIQTARSAFKKEENNFHVLILITDGEDHENEEGTLDLAKKAAQEGIKIFTIGVGTASGELLPNTDEKGQKGFVKDDQGNVVKSRLNELLLQQIATLTEAFYLPLQPTKTMETLYQRGLAPLPKSDISTKLNRRHFERYQWLLGFAIGLLVFEMFFPEHKKPGRPAPRLASMNMALLLACLLAGVGTQATAATAAKALRHYEQGNYSTARKEYEALAKENPKDPRLHFNAGAAAYRERNYVNAAASFEAALTAEELSLQEKAYYNLGNARYQLGETEQEPAEKAKNWELAVKQYETALKLKPDDQEARSNLEFVRKRIEDLKAQQKDEKKEDQNKQDDEKKDEKKEDANKDDQKGQDQKKQDPKDQDKNKEDGKDKEPKDSKDDAGKGKDKEKNEKKGADQADPKKDPQPKEQSQNDAKKGDKGEENKDASASPMTQNGVMTQEQAEKLLDASKSDEKALIFQPTKKPGVRFFKDW